MDGIVHAQGESADAVPGLVFLGGHTLAAGHDAFDLAEIDDDIAALEAADGAGEYVARAALELLEHHILLDLADALQHRLFCRLCGDAAEILRGNLDFDAFPKLDVWVLAAGIRQRDFIVLVDDVFDHQLLRERANSAGLAVDLDTEIVRGTDTLLGRLEQRLLDRLEQDFPVDALFALEILHSHNKFAVHKLFLPIWPQTPFGE